jgi:hypothetical protein
MAADHHIRFFPQCGICADVILKNERLITRMNPFPCYLMDFLFTQFAVFGNQDFDNLRRPHQTISFRPRLSLDQGQRLFSVPHPTLQDMSLFSRVYSDTL